MHSPPQELLKTLKPKEKKRQEVINGGRPSHLILWIFAEFCPSQHIKCNTSHPPLHRFKLFHITLPSPFLSCYTFKTASPHRINTTSHHITTSHHLTTPLFHIHFTPPYHTIISHPLHTHTSPLFHIHFTPTPHHYFTSTPHHHTELLHTEQAHLRNIKVKGCESFIMLQ